MTATNKHQEPFHSDDFMGGQVNNIVIVRFSLKLNKAWQIQAYGSDENRSKWFAYRMSLFNEFLAPALRNQTVKSVENFVLMDADDKNDYQKSEHLISDIVTPIFSTNNNHFRQVSEHIKKVGYVNVALSRIDSDDIVLNNYFEEVNRSIRSATEQNIPFTYVVSTRGYRATREQWQNIYYNCSPFLTRFVAQFNGENIYDISHETIIDKLHIKCELAKWIQIIHTNNIGNTLIGSKLNTTEFLTMLQENPKLIASKPVSFIEDTPLEISPFLDSLKHMTNFIP
jgi:hypothetical protein